ncbi:MAG TPA: RagB/SusD family nutrient uptake outer membrane protein [Mucilaginibacter sp.]|nr:RagB/SusD family nutrient uptake outer membrane protein [Mucilaginibacter sp.]
MKLFRKKIAKGIFLIVLFTIFSSCKKLVDVNPPVTGTTGVTVFDNNALAIAAITNIYANTSQLNENLGNEGISSLSVVAGLASDEISFNNSPYFQFFKQYYTNSLTSNGIQTDLWSTIYPIIFISNSAIEGLNESSKVSTVVKQQLLGEAKFMRAFCYFYLVNLYGDVPIVTTTDFKANSLIPRSAKSEVYKQIISDLTDATRLLSENYLDATLLKSTTERVRPTKWAAMALLARVYLYTEQWANAEMEASNLINQTSLFNIVSLNDVFLKNSQETIWSLQPVGTGVYSNTGEGNLFILPNSGPADFQYPIYLNNNLIASFESNDNRKYNWLNSVSVGSSKYYYAFKYKIGRDNPSTSKEYIMVFRLAEQYLIRSEARAQSNNISGASQDLNVIRTRAGLSNTTATTQEQMLNAILHERQVELFTEWGHRWLDLKRTGKIDAVMSTVTPQKGGTWETTDQLWPIPQSELNANPNLVQNPGYN